MSIERVEWVEIIEPKTKEHMYVNLTTGECVWDPPVGVLVKKTDSNQWWELFDENTNRFYYYNATSQKTVWHRPQNSDIIPLAKLQTLKQNTEPVNDLKIDYKETVATQTPGRTNNVIQTAVVTSTRPIRTLDGNENTNTLIKCFVPRQTVVSCETQTSPISVRRSHHHHHHHHHHRRHNQTTSNQGHAPKKLNQNPWCTRNVNSQESGRSSDSSSLSQQSGVKPYDFPVPSSSSNTAPLTEINSVPSTNLTKPRISQVQRSYLNVSQHLNKQKSFDTDISIGGGYSLGYESRGSCTRSKPVILSSSFGPNNQVNRSHSFAQPPSSATVTTNSSPSAATDNEEEDSMHEKYFSPNILSVHGEKNLLDTTPLISRPKPHSETSSPIVSSGASSFKANPPDYVNFINPLPIPSGTQTVSSLTSRSSSSNSSTLASFSKHQLPLLKSKLEVKFSSSEDILNDVNNSSSLSASSSPPTAATPPRKLYHSKSPNLPEDINENIESVKNRSTKNHLDTSLDHRFYSGSSNSIQNTDKKNVSPVSEIKAPLYSNMNYSFPKNHSINLHLDQYIREQAVLSGCYRFGDHVTQEGDEPFQSEDEEQHPGEYDSDEFADDEGMSNMEDEDSSSQEYLQDENPHFLTYHHRSSSSHKEYSTDGRVCDYFLESGIATNTGHYYNVAHDCSRSSVISEIYQKYSRPNNLVPTIHPVHGVRCSSPNSLTPLETQHTSLKRRKEPLQQQTLAMYSPILDRSERLVSIASQKPYFYRKDFVRRSDHAITYRDDISHSYLNKEKKLTSDSDIEKYAQDNLNIHKKGIFRKKSSLRSMLSWSKDSIRKPMLVLSDKSLKRDACELFKLLQIYMKDRKTKADMTSNDVALEICSMAYNKLALRDELYIQICRQTTENPNKESLRRGWELLAICLVFFPPSPKFEVYLDSYMNRHRDQSYDFPEVDKWPIHVQVSHYATVACKRLERIGINGKKINRKPTLDEIEQAKNQIFELSMFGNTLQEIMNMQKDRFPHYKLPWVQTTLSELVLRLQGTHTEGIFRVPADMDEVMSLKKELDKWEVPDVGITDAHTPASLLKLWYRELYEPLIPDSVYEQCVTYHDDPDRVLAIIEMLPEINKLVLAYLINFLQMFANSEISLTTKMDASNLAMVMAPNCLRCTSEDPRIIFDNARKEMAFMRTLIQRMDTRFIEGIL